MAMKLYEENGIQNIANEIRFYNEKEDKYSVKDMTLGIQDIAENIEDKLGTTKTVEGTDSLSYEDAKEYRLIEAKYKGNVEQETTSGKNLFNYEDTTMVTDGITVDEDGWITATFDNTNGTSYKYLNFYTNNLNLKNSTTYGIVSEIKSVSGTGFFIPVSKKNDTPQIGGQFNSEVSYNFATLTNNMIKIETPTTIDDFSTTNSGLRTLLKFAKGQSGSITFRLSVLEDTSVTADTFVYEKFTGGQPSPNPEYPQEIKTLKGFNKEQIEINGHIYEPYNCLGVKRVGDNRQERIDYIDLQGNELLSTDKIKVDSKGNVKLIKNWGKVVLDGSESGWYFNSQQHGFSINGQIGTSISPIMLSNSFICENTYTTWTGENKFGSNVSGTLWFQTTVASSVADFKAWLSTHNITVYYQLATPQEIDLGKTTIKSLKGMNNVEILATLEPTFMSEEYMLNIQSKYLPKMTTEETSIDYVAQFPLDITIEGNIEQETTTGKNLFDESIMPTNTMNGIKWEYTNKKIKISGTATDTLSHNENIQITLQA